MGFAIGDARIRDLRNIYPKNRLGMRLRADDTRSLVRQMIVGDPTACNLIDGAVLQAHVGVLVAWFEADALAARFGGAIHVGEVKSFPVVDERAARFELPAAHPQQVQGGRPEFTRGRSAPQLLVANEATVDMLGRLGRRLAYLPTDGP
jgi:hypothetical protein